MSITYIITPVYEDNKAAQMLFANLATLPYNSNIYIVAVDDGSVREPLLLSSLSESACKGEIIRLRRNVGHQKAIAIGLARVNEIGKSGDVAVIMDSDGEDKPESIEKLIAALTEDNTDVVFSGRKSRVETLKFKLFYQIYRFFFRLLAGKDISFGNFMAIKFDSLDRIVFMHELPVHVAAAVLSSRLRYKVVPIDRGARYAGKSKMNFAGLVLHGFRALMVFSDSVLVRLGIFSTVLAVAAFLASITAIVLKTAGLASQGWFSVAFGILGVVFLQALSLAVLSLVAIMLSKSSGSGIPLDHKENIKQIEKA